MLSEDLHLSDSHIPDQELLRAADGELATRRRRTSLTPTWQPAGLPRSDGRNRSNNR